MNIVEQITNYLIRPTRERYHINRLGPTHLFVHVPGFPSSQVFREDGHFLNNKKQKIYYSFYNNVASQVPNICVFYLHANNGSRVEGLHYLHALLESGFNVCLLDFAGSGMSEGEFVTLGIQEFQDLEFLYQELRSKKGISKVLLWGRSMGACTALIYANKYPNNVLAMVVDSPFKDLRKLVKEAASERTGLPKIFFEPVLNMVDNGLQNKICHRFEEYKMKKYIIGTSPIPILFITSSVDKLVKSNHVEKLYSRYPGIPNQTKILHFIPNQHHENRDISVIQKCVGFLKNVIEGRQKSFELTQIYAEANNRQFNSIESVEKYSFKNKQVIKAEKSFRSDKSQPFFCLTPGASSQNEIEIEQGALSTSRKAPIFSKEVSLEKYHTNQINGSLKIKLGQNHPRNEINLSFQGTHSRNQSLLNSKRDVEASQNLGQSINRRGKEELNLRSTMNAAQSRNLIQSIHQMRPNLKENNRVNQPIQVYYQNPHHERSISKPALLARPSVQQAPYHQNFVHHREQSVGKIHGKISLAKINARFPKEEFH